MTKQDSHHYGIIEVSGYNQEKITLGAGGMKKLTILAVAGLMSVTASAANWLFVSENEKATSYIDVDSISTSSGYKSAFIRFNIIGYDEIGGDKYDSITGFYQYDCKANPRKYKVLSAMAKDGSQMVVSSNSLKNFAGTHWMFIYPDSMNEDLANFICSYKK